MRAGERRRDEAGGAAQATRAAAGRSRPTAAASLHGRSAETSSVDEISSTLESGGGGGWESTIERAARVANAQFDRGVHRAAAVALDPNGPYGPLVLPAQGTTCARGYGPRHCPLYRVCTAASDTPGCVERLPPGYTACNGVWCSPQSARAAGLSQCFCARHGRSASGSS